MESEEPSLKPYQALTWPAGQRGQFDIKDIRYKSVKLVELDTFLLQNIFQLTSTKNGISLKLSNLSVKRNFILEFHILQRI